MMVRDPDPALAAVLLGVLCACEGTPPAAVCNETFDSAARTVEATYVPYRWCDDIQSEADRTHGSYACTSENVDLRGEVVTMTVEQHGEIEDSLIVIGVVGDEAVEVVSWSVDITFTSEAFAVFIPSEATVFELGDGDRTVLFHDLYAREDIDGWLLEGVEGAQGINIFSATPVGESPKRWSVYVGDFGDRVELSCE